MVTMKEKMSVLQAMHYIGRVCDGAHEKDGQGFMKGHADAYKSFYGVSVLTPNQEKEWYQRLGYYSKTQLQNIEVIKPTDKIISEEEKEQIYNKQFEEVAIGLKKEAKIVSENPLVVSLNFSYNAWLINKIKQIPHRRYSVTNQNWEITIYQDNINLVKEFCIKYKIEIPTQLNSIKIEDLGEAKVKKTKYYIYKDNLIKFYFPYNDQILREVKTLSGRKFQPEGPYWLVPLKEESHQQILNFISKFGFEFEDEESGKLLIDIGKIGLELLTKQKKQEENFEKSSSHISGLEIEGLKGTLRPFQKAGVEYAVLNKKTIIGDEMGLGKTVEAIATIHYLNSYPCLVSCPNSLKYNWKSEWNNWVDKKVIIINSEDEVTEDLTIIEEVIYPVEYLKEFKDGWYRMTETGFKKVKTELNVEEIKNPDLIVNKIDLLKADVIIVNYNTASKYQTELKNVGFKSIIMDESHYLKNNKANRTKAMKYLSEKVDVLLQLTGTLIVNRPVELTSQLDILGKLEEFGGWWGFVKKYCNVNRTPWGLEVSGACNLEELHKELRKICYIRRNKSEVLTELPEKQRTIIEVELSNRKEYNKAERELIEYLRNEVKITNAQLKDYYREFHKEDETKFEDLLEDQKIILIEELRKHKARNAQSAEHLVQINTLKKLCAEGKIEGAIEWITDFLETGEKLVVFGYHTSLINELAQHFNCNKITGEVKVEDRHKYVEDFQNNPNTNLIILNLQAGGVGLTLTKSSNVLFIEQGWTSTEHDQAEDRTHRITQKNAVNCWYLLGKNTIDGNIYELIAEKRKITNAVNAGIQDNTKVSILNELIKKLRTK